MCNRTEGNIHHPDWFRVLTAGHDNSCAASEIWRRGQDSNLRCPYGHTCFQDKRIQPLCHPSAEVSVRDRTKNKSNRETGRSVTAKHYRFLSDAVWFKCWRRWTIFMASSRLQALSNRTVVRSIQGGRWASKAWFHSCVGRGIFGGVNETTS